MNAFIATLYGFTIWLALLAYCLIVGGPTLRVAFLGPFIVSGFVVLVLAMDYGFAAATSALRRYRDAVN